MKGSIIGALSDFASKTEARFHMPGHKGRGIGSLPFDAALPFDLTELDPTDNLYDPSENGVFRAELDFMRGIYGTASTVLTAGGATSAICAAIACCAARVPGKPVLCDRNAHLSVINAFVLLGIEPVWFDASRADNKSIINLAHKYRGTLFAAVFVTSPDYYGRGHDIFSLRSLAQTLDAPLIVDNSHGSHLFFHDGGVLHPLKLGGSIVIDSMHKTLPALTGAALLHASSGTSFFEAELLSGLKLFVSTSPSYLISSSACACVREMAGCGREAHQKLLKLIVYTRIRLADFGYTLENNTGDPFRLCIADANPRGLYEYLAEQGVVCEFFDSRYVVLLTSIRNTKADFDLLLKLCKSFNPKAPAPISQYTFRLPERAMPMRDAALSGREYVYLNNACGRIAAAPATPYPPGVPVIMPGEIFDSDVISALHSYNPKMKVAVYCIPHNNKSQYL